MAEKSEVVSYQIQKLDSFANRVGKLEAAERGAVTGSDTLSAVLDFPPLSAALLAPPLCFLHQCVHMQVGTG